MRVAFLRGLRLALESDSWVDQAVRKPGLWSQQQTDSFWRSWAAWEKAGDTAEPRVKA